MGFDETEAAISGIEGWLRVEQARRLWELAAAVPPHGVVVEIGSFQGKSTVALARGAPETATVYAIDPHAGNDRGPGQWHGDPADGQADHVAFLANLADAAVSDRVVYLRARSEDAHPQVAGPVDLLYVDGAHGYGPARGDLVGWGDRVRPGGVMAVHDVYASAFVTLAVMRSLWFSRRWRYLDRVRSLVVYERVPVSGLEWLTNLARQLSNLGWFAKNVVVRGLSSVGLERFSRWGQGPGGGVY